MSTPSTASGAATPTRPTKRPATTSTPKAPAAERAAAKAPAGDTAAEPAGADTAAAKTAAAKGAASEQQASTPLHEREPREVATAAGLALAALVADAVEALGRLPRDAERLRDEARPIAEAAPARLRGELERVERALSEAIDARAPRGRAVVDEFVARPEVRELRERAEALRDRLRRALGIDGGEQV